MNLNQSTLKLFERLSSTQYGFARKMINEGVVSVEDLENVIKQICIDKIKMGLDKYNFAKKREKGVDIVC